MNRWANTACTLSMIILVRQFHKELRYWGSTAWTIFLVKYFLISTASRHNYIFFLHSSRIDDAVYWSILIGIIGSSGWTGSAYGITLINLYSACGRIKPKLPFYPPPRSLVTEDVFALSWFFSSINISYVCSPCFFF